VVDKEEAKQGFRDMERDSEREQHMDDLRHIGYTTRDEYIRSRRSSWQRFGMRLKDKIQHRSADEPFKGPLV
jgi:hypothetical protein